MHIPEMKQCRICPRECGADRENGRTGVCGMTAELRVARAALHLWEEPCITGTAGSGTVFFVGCSLRCVYCQNRVLTDASAGCAVTVERLADIFLELQEKQASNINLVTPSHYFPQIARAIRLAKETGLRLPIVCNCGGYEAVESLRRMGGLIDVYLTDYKYRKKETAARYSHAADYPERAAEALAEMVRQCPEPVFAEDGRMVRGVIVRHLLLPGQVENARQVVEYVHRTYGSRVYLSLMNQFTPLPGLAEQYPELGRRVTKREYERLLEFALDLGVEQGFFQEGETAKESFIPAFTGEGV